MQHGSEYQPWGRVFLDPTSTPHQGSRSMHHHPLSPEPLSGARVFGFGESPTAHRTRLVYPTDVARVLKSDFTPHENYRHRQYHAMLQVGPLMDKRRRGPYEHLRTRSPPPCGSNALAWSAVTTV
ncbi:hypothetical protein ANO14919_069700 [Xylariales sp. No.14919]|nr:hypothetical protein ANO14919_069700 [Xylariales sp. No.14919]